MADHHTSTPRGIDHAVIATRDLDALANSFAELGFKVGARNRHPWGTENHIVQFDGSFIELIGIGAGASIAGHEPGRFSFGGFVRDYLEDGEGMAMLALESHNATGDREAFRKARIGDFSRFDFARSGQGAEGKPVDVAFSLAFAELSGSPRAAFFVCQQHKPQNFWSRAVQKHPNGATGIASVVVVADDPSDTHEFLGAFVNQREMRATSFGLDIDTGRGRIEVLSPDAFAYRFGAPAPARPKGGAQFAGLTIAGASVARLEKVTQAARKVVTARQTMLVTELFGGACQLGFDV
ncbi:MAG TPA: VOC family protein [Beijerinckiaceae bacterium]|nr:VOC family protein [Beijerinckiaceae bacterium]